MFTVTVNQKVIAASNVRIEDELNELSIARFLCDNTPFSRNIIKNDASVVIKYFGTTVFEGYIVSHRLHHATIAVKCVDKAFELSKTIFQKDQGQTDMRVVLYKEIAANSILSDVLANTGYTGSAPTTVVSVRFEHMSRLKCVRELARVLAKDWWRVGTTIYIGDKGTDKVSFKQISVLEKDEYTK